MSAAVVTAPAATAAPQTDLSTGLSSAEAASLLAQYGPNGVDEKKQSAILKFLSYFWGPIPWMVEVAALLSALVRHWPDFFIVLALLIFNGLLGFWQEFKAADALAALTAGLALKARALRDGKWGEIAARDLVPGDVVRIRLGDVIPADVRLMQGAYLSVDQAALTGESLPVTKKPGDDAYSGSIAKQGEMVALVTLTGARTLIGKTTKLVESAGATSHFQKAVMKIGNFLIISSLALSVLLVAVELWRGEPLLGLLQFVLILTVAAIPVAMPAVLSVTMALGALALSREKAIVTRLQSIEEMAGMDVLCSDKTGTLTQNKLTLGEPVLFAASDAQALYRAAAFACKEEDADAIDLAVVAGVADRAALSAWQQTDFVPFDPVSKRTEATIKAPDGQSLHVTKGAPQVIASLARLQGEAAARADAAVLDFAKHGYRALGVAQSQDDGKSWEFLGILSLFDPPRDSAAETIARAKEHGVAVKMITGDDVAIACEIAGKLGLGTNIVPASDVFGADGGEVPADVGARVEAADGFARVFPEHKFRIVKALQTSGHITGMTGDGVNDSPAIKQADVGIAVSGATDAARAAADLVLTKPGLSTIINAIEEARRIFERMNAYAIYRINETIRTMVFVVLAMIVFGFYPITAIMIILVALLNDLPIMMIAYDNTRLPPKPVAWDMPTVLTVALVMGVVGTAGSMGMIAIGLHVLHLSIAQIQTYIFLQLAIGGHMALFVARTRGWMVSRPWPSGALFWSAVLTKVAATFLVVYPMGLFAAVGWKDVAIVWGYSLAFAFLTDCSKLAAYHWLGRGHLADTAPA